MVAFFDNSQFDDVVIRTGFTKRYFGTTISHLEMCPQFVIGSYRCDFAFYKLHPHGRLTRIIVECDGHDFHDRTKEQAQRDKSRDRYLQTRGWRVLRFTGSEIYRNAQGCVAEIATVIENDMIDDWRSANG